MKGSESWISNLKLKFEITRSAACKLFRLIFRLEAETIG